MTVTYRDATPADAAALDGLFDSVFCDTFAHLYRPDDLSAFLSSFGISDWEEQLRDPAFAVRIAEVDGAGVGFVKIGPMKLPVEQCDPSSMLLDQLYVRGEHHGSGIARELMDWAIEEARRRGADALYLTVFIDNERARRFYDRFGFEDVGRYAFMVGKQADEDIIMRKTL
jgi:ribosomal protein S18 acetylase RimI-like enzyme